MYCTTCEMLTEGVKHYKSQLHAINIQRRASGYTPLTTEEFESDSKTDDLIFDINHEHGIPPLEGHSAALPAHGRTMRCLFCEQEETTAHYREHGLSIEEITYIQRRQFATKELLLKHLELGAHRTAVTDGQLLYLENGRILQPGRKHLENTITALAAPEPKAQVERDPEHEKFLDRKRLNDYKCSLLKGKDFKKTPF